MVNLESIWAACAARSDWSALVGPAGPILRTVIRRQARRSLCAADIDDIQAEVWIRLLASGGHRLAAWDRNRGSLSGYLGLIAAQVTRAWCRRETTHSHEPLEAWTGVTHDDGLAWAIARDTWRLAVETVSGAERAWLVEAVWEGRNNNEIAAARKTANHTVSARGSKVRARLRAVLGR